MTGLKIGDARVLPTNHDLTAQRDGLAALGVDADRIYVDHGLSGTTRARPGPREPWQPAAPATPSWSPSSTASHG